MRRQTLLLLVMVTVLLLNNAAQAQSPLTEQTQAVLTGGSYRLITNVLSVTDGLSSAQYRLLLAAPAAGEGCCCKTNLPCLLK